MTTSIVAASCPAIQQPAGFLSLSGAKAGSFTALVAEIANDILFLFKVLSPHATRLDLFGRGGGGNAFAIDLGNGGATGLAMVNPGTGLTLTVRKGYALIGGAVAVESDATVVLPDNTADIWIWLQRTGAIIAMTTTTPPVTPSCLIGHAVTSGGNITAMDTSGVLYLAGGGFVRYTGDAGAPGDAPPANLLFHTITPGGTYFWNGASYLPISGAGSGSVTSVAQTVPAGFSVSGSPVTSSGTLAITENSQSANTIKSGPTTGSAATPTFRALVPADIPAIDAAKITSGVLAIGRLATGTPSGAKFVRDDGTLAVPAGSGTGTVNSVALSAPGIFSVSGSPVTTTGTLALALATQTANQVWCGPTTGSPAAPTFRGLVAGDIPALDASIVTSGVFAVARLGTGTPTGSKFLRDDGTFAVPSGGGSGTVTSVALSAPGIFSVSGSPVTTTGTLALALATQTANLVWAGPGSGSAATPTFRSLVALDIPSLPASQITSGTVATARLGSGTANSGTFLRGDQTWAAAGGGGSTAPIDVLMISCGASQISWAVPSAVTEFNGGTFNRSKHDLTNATQARIVISLYAGSSPVNIPTLAAQYYDTTTSSWLYLDASSGPVVTWGSGTSASSWVSITTLANADVQLRVVGAGGNGVAAVNFGAVYVQVK